MEADPPLPTQKGQIIMKKVLVVCLGNTCRSPMFAALLKQRLVSEGQTDVIVESAGVLREAVGQPAAADWATLIVETRVDLSEHKSRHIEDVNPSSFDTIVCVDPKAFAIVTAMEHHATRVVLASPETQGVYNPWQKGIDAYRECFAHCVRGAAALAL